MGTNRQQNRLDQDRTTDPEEQEDENKAIDSYGKLNATTEEVDEETEKQTKLTWSDRLEIPYDKPTGEVVDSRTYRLTLSGTIYYPDCLQKKHGTLENFITGSCKDFIDDGEVKGSMSSFGKESFVSKKIDDKNHEVLAKYLFRTESEPYFPEPNDERI